MCSHAPTTSAECFIPHRAVHLHVLALHGEFGCRFLFFACNVNTLTVMPRVAWTWLDQAGEKMKEQQLLESEGRPVDQRETPVNPFLNDLLAELHRTHQDGRLDGFLWYMYGIVTRDIQRNGVLPETMSGCPSAKESLIESVKLYPWNWSAWKDLADLCLADDEVRAFEHCPADNLHSVHLTAFGLRGQLPQFETGGGKAWWMHDLFSAHVLLEQQKPDQALQVSCVSFAANAYEGGGE